MGLFTRLTDIVVANLNALLDKVENPERMLAQIIREMEDGLATARQQAVWTVAGERRLFRELEQHRAEAESWKARAHLALENQREDLARLALARHFEHADQAQLLRGQYAAAQQTTVEVKTALHALESRLAQARRCQNRLQTRLQAAAIQNRANASLGQDPRSPFARFARLENRLVELEDDLRVHTAICGPNRDLEAELAQLATDQRVAGALVTLKQETAAVDS